MHLCLFPLAPAQASLLLLLMLGVALSKNLLPIRPAVSAKYARIIHINVSETDNEKHFVEIEIKPLYI